MASPRSACSSRDWRAVRQPSPASHKGDNGRLLVLAGSRQYHGSLILAVQAAARFCDLVYAHSSPENKPLVQKIKSSSPNLIYLDSKALPAFFPRMDAFCVGPGWEKNSGNRSLLGAVLKTKKPAVIDATAFDLLDKKKLHPNAILTPHHGEFVRLFGQSATPASVRAMAKKHHCVILCKGPTDFIASPASFAVNRTHHVGMTKGGTGDVLSGLLGALLASHTPAFQAAKAAAYLNGLAGVRLSKKMGPHYSSDDLASELPSAARAIE
ncbi:MAG: NAD(P)H-hydrate dehydratase [Candidatus Micrarchaeota archaeon]|nr:NAD(P)H-hydrate dehydratase [Candidatus Micrarchaeota archaeon]